MPEREEVVRDGAERCTFLVNHLRLFEPAPASLAGAAGEALQKVVAADADRIRRRRGSRFRGMPRRRKVTAPDRLDWTVKRLLVPNALRPMSRTDILDAATPRRTHVDGAAGSVPDAFYGVTGPLPLGALFSLAMLPLVPVVLALRYARLVRWTIEARTYPWGRRYPPVVLSYLVRGHREARQAVDQLADALAGGDGSPTLAHAEFVPQSRSPHDGSGGRATFDSRKGSVYRPGRR